MSCLSVGGEVDAAGAAAFRAHLTMAAQGSGGIVLDLTDLRYVDSSGINTLLDVHRAASASGRWMALAAASPVIRRILGVIQLQDIIPMFDTVEDAVAYVRRRSG